MRDTSRREVLAMVTGAAAVAGGCFDRQQGAVLGGGGGGGGGSTVDADECRQLLAGDVLSIGTGSVDVNCILAENGSTIAIDNGGQLSLS